MSELFFSLAFLSFSYYLFCAVKVSFFSSILYFWPLLGLFFGICGLFPRAFFYLSFPFFLFLFLFFLFLFFALAKPKDHREPHILLVLGIRFDQSLPEEIFWNRVKKAAQLMKKYPRIKAILSGGTVFGETESEAVLLAEALEKEGIERERLILEKNSKTTAENFRFSLPYLEKEHPVVGIVTSRYHFFRSRHLAKAILKRKLSFFVTASPVYFLPHLYVREFFTFSVHALSLIISRFYHKPKRR